MVPTKQKQWVEPRRECRSADWQGIQLNQIFSTCNAEENQLLDDLTNLAPSCPPTYNVQQNAVSEIKTFIQIGKLIYVRKAIHIIIYIRTCEKLLYKGSQNLLHMSNICDRIWEKGPLCDKNPFLFQSITRISLF